MRLDLGTLGWQPVFEQGVQRKLSEQGYVITRGHRTRECGTHRLRKHRYEEKQFLGAAGFQWKSFARALTYLLQPPHRRKGNPWFFGYFGLFFVFFFAFATEITCGSNVAIAGLTLPTVTKFCPGAQALLSFSSSSTAN
jgi:hypothetical protein